MPMCFTPATGTLTRVREPVWELYFTEFSVNSWLNLILIILEMCENWKKWLKTPWRGLKFVLEFFLKFIR
jgi:hypothetical protein